MRFKLTLEYAGTRYSGWQIQKNARTVQGTLDRAVREAANTTQVQIYGSGRTDAGVHALAQVAHMDLDTTLPPATLKWRINEALPSDINVLAIERTTRKFHARHDAVARSYLYQIARRRTAFAKAFVWWVKDELDVAAMQRSARRFVGMHDFRSFSDDDPDEKSTQVLVDTIDVHEDGDLIVVHVEASHFLWKMARRLVGVLVEVGRGSLTGDAAAGFLQKHSPLPARVTAPASGLFLERVYYSGDSRDAPIRPASVVASVS
jgi:tRNA pseudouridine38-40 synthase